MLEQKWLDAIEHLPHHMQSDVATYIERGNLFSPFLYAVFSSNLKEAYQFADDINTAAMHMYVRFLSNGCPSACQGTVVMVENWIKSGGLAGQEKAYVEAQAQKHEEDQIEAATQQESKEDEEAIGDGSEGVTNAP